MLTGDQDHVVDEDKNCHENRAGDLGLCGLDPDFVDRKPAKSIVRTQSMYVQFHDSMEGRNDLPCRGGQDQRPIFHAVCHRDGKTEGRDETYYQSAK